LWDGDLVEELHQYWPQQHIAAALAVGMKMSVCFVGLQTGSHLHHIVHGSRAALMMLVYVYISLAL